MGVCEYEPTPRQPVRYERTAGQNAYTLAVVMKAFTRVSFDEIKAKVPTGPGIYKIYTLKDEPLKVGIAGNLQKRLRQHRDSRQKYLQLKPRGTWANRSDVVSKRSILAKHFVIR